MSIPVIAFFNNKGGVGKTTMVSHLAWMLAELGVRVVAADLDPQANLTASFLNEDGLEALFCADDQSHRTIFGALEPLMKGTGDVAAAIVQPLHPRLKLISGDMALSRFEDQLSEAWPKCLDGDERSFRVTSAFWRILQETAKASRSELILMDLGPNLGAINRAVLIASNFVVIPLVPDLYSIQGLQNLGPALRRWRGQWKKRLDQNPDDTLELPGGRIDSLGYVILRHSIRLDRPVQAFERWMAKIPAVYSQAVLQQENEATSPDDDPNCIAKLKDYRSLMPLAQESRKPMFFLKPADGALGAHANAVKTVYAEFRAVAKEVAKRSGISIPAEPV